jgi:two-component system, LuxR family, response regulator FixJ
VIRSATVFVVDDDEHMRSALRRVLRAAGLEVESHASADEFLASWRPERFGCAVLDLQMPGMNGLELQREMNARGIRMPVLFLTGSAHVTAAVAAMRAGAFDFIEKPFDNAELVARIQRALELGVEWRKRELSRAEIDARRATLTPREREVLAMLLEGKASKVIAIELGMSPRTVEVHRARVMEKMQAATLAQLVRMSMEPGPSP